MDINDFKPNSEIYKKGQVKERERPKPVIPTGSVTSKKKSAFRRLIFSLLSNDVDSIGDSLLSDFVIPGIRDFIADGLEMLIKLAFYGKDAKRIKGNGTVISYNSFSSNKSRASASSNTGYILDEDLIFEPKDGYSGKELADLVMDAMYNALEEYDAHEVTVRDFYDFCGRTSPNEFVDQYRGWKDLRGTHVTVLGGGRAKLYLPRYQDLR